MREIQLDINKPIWGGGRPQIGVADFRLKNADIIKVRILYTRKKDGVKSYPHTYVMPVDKLTTYPIQVVAGGVRLYVAPLSDWDIA